MRPPAQIHTHAQPSVLVQLIAPPATGRASASLGRYDVELRLIIVADGAMASPAVSKTELAPPQPPCRSDDAHGSLPPTSHGTAAGPRSDLRHGFTTSPRAHSDECHAAAALPAAAARGIAGATTVQPEACNAQPVPRPSELFGALLTCTSRGGAAHCTAACTLSSPGAVPRTAQAPSATGSKRAASSTTSASCGGSPVPTSRRIVRQRLPSACAETSAQAASPQAHCAERVAGVVVETQTQESACLSASQDASCSRTGGCGQWNPRPSQRSASQPGACLEATQAAAGNCSPEIQHASVPALLQECGDARATQHAHASASVDLDLNLRAHVHVARADAIVETMQPKVALSAAGRSADTTAAERQAGIVRAAVAAFGDLSELELDDSDEQRG